MGDDIQQGLEQLRRSAPEVDQTAQALYAEIVHKDGNTLDANQAHTDVSTKFAQITNSPGQILVLADMILTDQKQHQDNPNSPTLRLFPEAANHDGDSAPARIGVWAQAADDQSLTSEQLKYDAQVKQEILQKAACIASLASAVSIKQAIIEDSTCRREEGPWQALDRMMGHDVSSATKLKIDHAIKLLYRQEHGRTDISSPEDRKNHRGLPDVPVGYQWINDSNFEKLRALSPEFKAWFDTKCATAIQVAGETPDPAPAGTDTTPPAGTDRASTPTNTDTAPTPTTNTDASTDATSQLQWNRDLNTALEQARKQNKPVLVDVYTDWCTWCKRLDSDTYSNPDVARFLNQGYVLLKINAEDGGAGEAFANKYNPQGGYPTILVLEPDGKLQGKFSGYLPPGAFQKAVSDAAGDV